MGHISPTILHLRSVCKKWRDIIDVEFITLKLLAEIQKEIKEEESFKKIKTSLQNQIVQPSVGAEDEFAKEMMEQYEEKLRKSLYDADRLLERERRLKEMMSGYSKHLPGTSALEQPQEVDPLLDDEAAKDGKDLQPSGSQDS